MMMEMFDRNWDAYVLHEADPRAFENFHLRPDATLQSLWRQAGHHTLVIKALLDAHRLPHLLNLFPNSRAVWAYRDPWATVRSNRRKWPDGRNQLEAVVADPTTGGYRGLGMSCETLEILRDVYRPDCNATEAMALFWWYRHRLYFSQNLVNDERVFLINYERLAANPDRVGSSLCNALGLRYAAPMVRHITNPDVPDSPGEPVSEDIRTLCREIWQSLEQYADF